MASKFVYPSNSSLFKAVKRAKDEESSMHSSRIKKISRFCDLEKKRSKVN